MTLKEGSVFKFRNRDFPEKRRPHIVVIITSQKKVLYVAASTKIERIKKRCERNPLTCVMAPISDCPPLDENSAINCNSHWIEEEYILRHANSFEVSEDGEACLDLLNKIKTGLLKSNNSDNTARKIIIDVASDN
jgi:hypothetical protein